MAATGEVRDGTLFEVTLRFRVTDAEKFAQLAEHAIENHGGGHEYDPGDPGDMLVELLLHSNPDIAGYLDYGVEYHEMRSEVLEP
jgi:hypothetical protein